MKSSLFEFDSDGDVILVLQKPNLQCLRWFPSEEAWNTEKMANEKSGNAKDEKSKDNKSVDEEQLGQQTERLLINQRVMKLLHALKQDLLRALSLAHKSLKHHQTARRLCDISKGWRRWGKMEVPTRFGCGFLLVT